MDELNIAAIVTAGLIGFIVGMVIDKLIGDSTDWGQKRQPDEHEVIFNMPSVDDVNRKVEALKEKHRRARRQ